MEEEQTDRMQASVAYLEQVASLAYQRWEDEGRPPGRNLEIWSWAEAQFLARQNPPRINKPRSAPTFPPSRL